MPKENHDETKRDRNSNSPTPPAGKKGNISKIIKLFNFLTLFFPSKKALVTCNSKWTFNKRNFFYYSCNFCSFNFCLIIN